MRALDRCAARRADDLEPTVREVARKAAIDKVAAIGGLSGRAPHDPIVLPEVYKFGDGRDDGSRADR